MIRRPPRSTLFPTRRSSDLLFDWLEIYQRAPEQDRDYIKRLAEFVKEWEDKSETRKLPEFIEYLDYFEQADRKSTRLNSSHANISYAVFCLEKQKHTVTDIC